MEFMCVSLFTEKAGGVMTNDDQIDLGVDNLSVWKQGVVVYG